MKRNRFERVLLVVPPKLEQDGYISPPLGLLYLAAYLRKKNKNISVAIVDGALEGETAVTNKIKRFKPDLVGITVLTPVRQQALRIARLAKKANPSCKIVFGGVHPTLMWEQIMNYYPEIDFIVRGEGEVTFWELVFGKDLGKIDGLVWRDDGGGVKKNKDRDLILDVDKIPFPAWDLINPAQYLARGEGIVNGINLEKEVRFPIISCTFCSSWRIWRGYRSRSGKNMADEVEFLVKKYQALHFNFNDDSFGGNRREVINFCQEIVRRRIKAAFVATTRVDLVDEKVLRFMKKAGFYFLVYGVESGSPKMLKKINKKIDLRAITRAFELTKKVGIMTSALMMFGLPEETDQDRKLTQKLLKEIRPDGLGSLGEVWVFPGTVLYQQAKSAGLIDDHFWLGKRPYYVYRGGIGNDPVNWGLTARDFLKFHFSGTLFDRIRISLLLLGQKFRTSFLNTRLP